MRTGTTDPRSRTKMRCSGFDDCPAGCLYSIFSYFRRVNGRTEYMGSFDTRFDKVPAWWTEAQTAYNVHTYGPDPVPAN